jgi:hypothetical protein
MQKAIFIKIHSCDQFDNWEIFFRKNPRKIGGSDSNYSRLFRKSVVKNSKNKNGRFFAENL